MNNPLQCIQINIQDPLVRSITSEMICALTMVNI